jgi:hypothetical protein
MTACIQVHDAIKGQHIHVQFGERLRQAVELIHHHPALLSAVGVIEGLNEDILVCSAIFGGFLQLKPNGVLRNMRQHGFVRDGTYDCRRALHALGINDRQCYGQKWFRWTNIVVPRFNRSASPSEIARLAAHARSVRNGGGIPPTLDDPFDTLFAPW